MEIEEIKRWEHITLRSDHSLIAFGEKFQKTFELPPMMQDNENETEWLDIDYQQINYNISRPYEEGVLHEWDDTTPAGCNFGIVLSIHKDHPFVLDNNWVESFVANICTHLAKIFKTIVYYHRTFTFGIDKSEQKHIMFNP